MAIKILDYSGDGTVSNAINALDYATNNGAHISNNSYGWAYNDPDLVAHKTAYSQAIHRARNKGKLLVAAAGNYQAGFYWYDNDEYAVYPANFPQDNVISVLSTDHNDNLSSFSHYGKTTVDIGAPGGTGDGSIKDIYSTMRYDGYQYLAGTSMATPYVTGTAALAWGKCPQLTYSQLKARILEKVDAVGALNNKCVSNGRLNAYNVIYDSAAPTG
jgi:subtilisin family serine protease